ncbi:MAG: hypothetical protein ACO1NS_12650 [Daejeonella sp.]
MELLHSKRFMVKLFINKELTAIITLFIAFLIFPFLVRQVDETAAAIDPGIFSAVLLAVTAVLIFQAVTWWIIRVIWTVFHTYSIHHFENNFKSLESWQKVTIYLAFYLLVLYSFVLVLLALV